VSIAFSEKIVDIKVPSEIGLKMSPLTGAGIKVLLSQLSDQEIDQRFN
jgi:hypothetical protein